MLDCYGSAKSVSRYCSKYTRLMEEPALPVICYSPPIKSVVREILNYPSESFVVSPGSCRIVLQVLVRALLSCDKNGVDLRASSSDAA
jgi:hypothetical protein